MSSNDDDEIEEVLASDPLLQREDQQPDSKHEERRRETMQFYVEQLTLLFYPLILTFVLVCWIETTLNIDNSQFSNPLMYYDESPTDTTSVRLGGSVLNAIIVVCGITVMTFMFVLCFKYRLYKFLYFWLGLSVLSILGVTASALWIEIMNVYQRPLDYLTMIFCTWNVSVVGVIAIFWKSPLWLQQAYLIVVSTATSISMLRMPSWTTWTVLIAVSGYDLFAVLCPSGPLRMLIDIAEERQESIPALIYSAGMASFDDDRNPIGGYRTGDTSTRSSSGRNKKDWLSWVPFLSNSSSNKGYRVVHGEEEGNENALRNGLEDPISSVSELSDLSNTRRTSRRREEESDDEDEDEDELNAIKLGLGDFIFYSVLVGKASRTDAVTLSLCVVAILTGLSITILILTLNRQALPALPISILFGAITYAVSYFMTSNMILTLSLKAIQF